MADTSDKLGQHKPEDLELLGSPELFEPNPLCQFVYPPMAETGLSESCPAGALNLRAKPEFTCGYLNVKTLQLGPEKKSKDRSWYCYWTQVSGDHLLFYKVESMSSHASSSPPPADKECPLKPHMQEADRLLLAGALVEMEYTYKADQKNRRRYLFRITLENGADYVLQAPSDGAAISWTATLRDLTGRFSQDSNKSTDLMQMMFIKTARGPKKGEAGKAPPTIITKPPPPLDPNVLHLRDILQKKVDLLYHLKQMEATFCSHHSQTRTPSPSPDIIPHQLSMDDDSVSSASDTSTGRNSRTFDKREATILSDYYMVAGAKWSLLHKGETVTVLQELPTGYFLVKTSRCTLVDVTTSRVKRNVSDGVLAGKGGDTAAASNHTATSAASGSPRRSSRDTPTILVEQSSNSSLVPSDSFQSNISDDSGIVEGAKRISNTSGNNDDEDKVAAGSDAAGSSGYLQMSQIKTGVYGSSLPRNFAPVGEKLATASVSDSIPNSVSCGNFSDVSNNKKDHVSLPLVGSVPPSILSCYADQLFHPTVKSVPTNSLSLQQTPVKTPTIPTKKKKQTTKGNRLSLQVDNFSEEVSPARKSSTLPHNGTAAVSPSIHKPERNKVGFKSFFKKRLSTSYERSSSVSSAECDQDKDRLSIQKEPMPMEIQRVQSPVYEYTPVTDSGEQFRRRGQSFVYAIGESSSDDDSDAESESSERHSSRVRRKKAIGALSRDTPPSSVGSSDSPPKDEKCMFEMSIGESPQLPQRRESRTKEDSPASPTGTESKKSPEKPRKSLKKVHSLPVNVTCKEVRSDETESEKRVHRLSVGDVPSVEIAIRAPPLNKRRHVYLDANVQKFGFRLETYGRTTFLGDVIDTVVYTVTQGTAAFLAGLYPGDVILEVEGEDVSNKNCNELGRIIASHKQNLQVICLTVKFIDGVKRLNLLKADMERAQKNRNSAASSDGDSSDTDTDKRISGPLSPDLTTPGLGRISETTEEEGMVEEENEDYTPQVISPSQA